MKGLQNRRPSLGSQVRRFFLKALEREDAAEMAEGEYESQAALHRCLPENVYSARAWGTLVPGSSSGNMGAFFLTEYCNLKPYSVTPKELATIMK